MATSLAPSGTLPSFLQGNPWQASQSYLNQLPGQFNTSGLQKSYQQQEAGNLSQGSALAAAAANQYVQRARQSGASTLGAGFAQASAMLPIYQQNAEMNSDLQNKLLQYHTQQAQIGAGLSGDIGRLQGQYQGTLADYFLSQQRLQQQQNQFGQTLGLQQQQTNQQGAYQQGQLRNQAAQIGLQYAPRPAGAYATNLYGSPMTGADARSMQGIQQNQNYLQGILGSLGYGGGVNPNVIASRGLSTGGSTSSDGTFGGSVGGGVSVGGFV